jgi:ketosteroid isomerase-like protein
MQRICAALAVGDAAPLRAAMADDTRAGGRYDNAYCWVCRFEGGKLRALTEYLDTRLLETALLPPARS